MKNPAPDFKFAIEELDKLALRLDAAAAIAEAKAKEHATHLLEMDDEIAQTERANSARHFAEVARYFAARERHREKLGKRNPLLEDVLDFAKTALPDWPQGDIAKWYDHFESNGWKVSGKTPCKNWQALARNGYRMWREKHPVKDSAAGSADPAGWVDWLRRKTYEYVKFKYAADHVKSEFIRSRKR